MHPKLSTQKIGAMWRAYKQHQSAYYVALTCSISETTARKYIANHNFAQRLVKLLAKVNEFVDEDQAKSLANTLKPLSNLRAILLNDALDHAKQGKLEATITDIDKIVRLERYLRGEPESRTEDVGTWKWLKGKEKV